MGCRGCGRRKRAAAGLPAKVLQPKVILGLIGMDKLLYVGPSATAKLRGTYTDHWYPCEAARPETWVDKRDTDELLKMELDGRPLFTRAARM